MSSVVVLSLTTEALPRLSYKFLIGSAQKYFSDAEKKEGNDNKHKEKSKPTRRFSPHSKVKVVSSKRNRIDIRAVEIIDNCIMF